MTIASATTAAAITDDLFGLPRAESSSDAATQVPSDSFQIERYARFISNYLQIITQHTGQVHQRNWSPALAIIVI
ncbi:hypothetical protein WT77_02445 [Burkholderia stagnalis]|nr:hypothetical protein WT18_27605 [Burkholderia stagnalis]KVP06992.1 hypothetical protein WT20_25820 [Burkholderia stagnalis]KVW97809.1 hypothetical protein WT30_08675 [Burkholderia stagnalis]KWH83478.1 hypothetical protein WT66_07095 [Burkholderia stagnalis]KWK32221.1 hypothetical protein WT77_02445 [Burkholderia stagnalis]